MVQNSKKKSDANKQKTKGAVKDVDADRVRASASTKPGPAGAQGADASGPQGAEGEPPKKKKLQPQCIRVDLFGDLLKFSKKAPDIQSPFRRYDQLALALAEEAREERLLLYHMFLGVALTAHARRIKDVEKRRSVFELKNKLFLNLANDFNLRRLLNFRLCVSRRFKVVRYCDDCTAKNKEANLDARDWKFCPKCTIDRDFYNVVSMFHKYSHGGASLFLGNDLLGHIRGLKVLKRVKFGQLKEEMGFKRYTFSPKNLVALDLNSLLAAVNKLLELDAKLKAQAPQPAFAGAGQLSAGGVGHAGGTPGSHPRPAFGAGRISMPGAMGQAASNGESVPRGLRPTAHATADRDRAGPPFRSPSADRPGPGPAARAGPPRLNIIRPRAAGSESVPKENEGDAARRAAQQRAAHPADDASGQEEALGKPEHGKGENEG